MGYFGNQVGRAVVAAATPPTPSVPAKAATEPHFAAQVGKLLTGDIPVAADRCPRCAGVLAEQDGFMLCGGRCEKRWVMGGAGRWLDPAVLPFGACNCCQPRVALVAAEAGAICPASHMEYLILPEGMMARRDVAPLGICRCCLPPQPLVNSATGLVCRNKPQQHYALLDEAAGDGKTIWLGNAPTLDQAAVTAAIDAALSANNAELTLFGLFSSPGG
jgi:hypothetical protein